MGGYWEVAAVEVFEMVLHLTSLALVVQETGKMICSLIFGFGHSSCHPELESEKSGKNVDAG